VCVITPYDYISSFWKCQLSCKLKRNEFKVRRSLNIESRSAQSLSVLKPVFRSHFICSLCWRTKSFSLFSACGPRDEPARNDGGSVTRFGTHHEGRSGGQQSPSHFFSLVSLRTVQLLQECSRRRPQTCGKFHLGDSLTKWGGRIKRGTCDFFCRKWWPFSPKVPSDCYHSAL
jgi:hypothetical protein